MQYVLQVFHDEDRREFRAIDIDGEPWFVLADVCRPLALGNVSAAASRLDPDEKGIITTDTPGGPQATVIVNESGLYSLILTSRKEGAKRFKKWITSEVLPSIRRSGGYGRAAVAPPAQWQPFLERVEVLTGTVPEGYFSIFNEMAALAREMIVAGISVDHRLVPDISIGIAWGKIWQDRGYDAEYGGRVRYPHSYPRTFPQAASNPQWSHAYPEDAIPVFRRWFRATYLKLELPRYLLGKAAKGSIARLTVNAALIAVGAIEKQLEPIKLPPRR